MVKLSRRALLKLGGFATATAWAACRNRAWCAVAAQPELRPAAYGAVTLHAGPMLAQFQAQHATLLAMDEDALLKPFRQASGLLSWNVFVTEPQ